MKKLLYASVSLFVIWFASTACFPIAVNVPTRPVPRPVPTATPCAQDPQSELPCGGPVQVEPSAVEQVG